MLWTHLGNILYIKVHHSVFCLQKIGNDVTSPCHVTHSDMNTHKMCLTKKHKKLDLSKDPFKNSSAIEFVSVFSLYLNASNENEFYKNNNM